MPDATTATDAPTTPAPVKPGYQTTEFWITVFVTLCGIAMASGLIAPGSIYDKAIGMALSTLAALGYTNSRATVKSGS